MTRKSKIAPVTSPLLKFSLLRRTV